jgi:hypothetical protein
MKQCTKCKLLKNKEFFNKNPKCADGLDYKCKLCWAQYRKLYRDYNLKKLRDYTNRKRAERIKWFHSLKHNVPCADCKKIYEPYCMDYDHILDKGEKIKEVSRMVLDNTPKPNILEEIKKCDLVCVLCHNRRTSERINRALGNTRKYKPHQLRNINIINNFKSKPCSICNNQYELYNMQIDHISNENKISDVCRLKNRKLNILIEELSKCQVLCALCHRQKSIKEQKEKAYSIIKNKIIKKPKLFFDLDKKIKECGLCHLIKSIDLFRANKKTISGLDTYCKTCFNAYRKQMRKNSK